MSVNGVNQGNFADAFGSFIQPFAPTTPFITFLGGVSFVDPKELSPLRIELPFPPLITIRNSSSHSETHARLERFAATVSPLIRDSALRHMSRRRNAAVDLGLEHMMGIYHLQTLFDHAVETIISDTPTDDILRLWAADLIDQSNHITDVSLVKASLLIMAGAYFASTNSSYENPVPEFEAAWAFEKAAEAMFAAAHTLNMPDLMAAAAAIYEIAGNCMDNLRAAIFPLTALWTKLAKKSDYYHDKASMFWTFAIAHHEEKFGTPVPKIFIDRGIARAMMTENKKDLATFSDTLARNSEADGKWLDAARHRLRSAYYEVAYGDKGGGRIHWPSILKNLEAVESTLRRFKVKAEIIEGLHLFIDALRSFIENGRTAGDHPVKITARI